MTGVDECEVLEHVEREVVAAIRFEAQHDEINPSSRVLGIGHPARHRDMAGAVATSGPPIRRSVPQDVLEPRDIRLNPFIRQSRANRRSLGRHREMSMNECAEIEAGFVLARLVVGKNSVRRLVGDQVRKGLAVPEYALELHLLEQLAQLLRRRHLRCTRRGLRRCRAGTYGTAQNNDKNQHASRSCLERAPGSVP
jgi:hypothetical protein